MRIVWTHSILTRRSVLHALGAAVLLNAFPARAALTGNAHTRDFEDAFAKLVAGRTPHTGAFTLDMPVHAENGNMVQFKLSAESPMTEAEHVTAMHLLSTQNPHAHVATFRFTPASGKAAVNGRMRLAKTQEVVALAEMSDGRLLTVSRMVEVTIGGCGI